MPIDFCITTMDRYDCLDQLLDSIFTYYPDAKVTVADQSKERDFNIYGKYGVQVINLPYDCGLSYARNELVRQTGQPYILLLEDDFLFTEDTKIEKMLTLAQKGDIVGGAVYKKDYRVPFEFHFALEGGILRHISDGNHWQVHNGITYKKTGCVLNFALFNRKIFNTVLWDPELKLREHQDFFLRAKDIPILFTEDVSIQDNKGKQAPKYKKMKARDEFYVTMMKKHGIHRIEYLNGSIVELEDNKITRS